MEETHKKKRDKIETDELRNLTSVDQRKQRKPMDEGEVTASSSNSDNGLQLIADDTVLQRYNVNNKTCNKDCPGTVTKRNDFEANICKRKDEFQSSGIIKKQKLLPNYQEEFDHNIGQSSIKHRLPEVLVKDNAVCVGRPPKDMKESVTKGISQPIVITSSSTHPVTERPLLSGADRFILDRKNESPLSIPLNNSGDKMVNGILNDAFKEQLSLQVGDFEFKKKYEWMHRWARLRYACTDKSSMLSKSNGQDLDEILNNISDDETLLAAPELPSFDADIPSTDLSTHDAEISLPKLTQTVYPRISLGVDEWDPQKKRINAPIRPMINFYNSRSDCRGQKEAPLESSKNNDDVPIRVEQHTVQLNVDSIIRKVGNEKLITSPAQSSSHNYYSSSGLSFFMHSQKLSDHSFRDRSSSSGSGSYKTQYCCSHETNCHHSSKHLVHGEQHRRLPKPHYYETDETTWGDFRKFSHHFSSNSAYHSPPHGFRNSSMKGYHVSHASTSMKSTEGICFHDEELALRAFGDIDLHCDFDHHLMSDSGTSDY